MADASDIERIVRLNGGNLVGKTRLQKSAYFLEVMNVGFGFDFSYHRFGPYSEEVASATDDAVALHFIDIDWKDSKGGARYAVLHSKLLEADAADQRDELRKKLLEILRRFSSVEVELAATADFLKRNGYASKAWAETERRKASKVDAKRLAASRQLLDELNSLKVQR